MAGSSALKKRPAKNAGRLVFLYEARSRRLKAASSALVVFS
jgi:hypothetical protein